MSKRILVVDDQEDLQDPQETKSSTEPLSSSLAEVSGRFH